MNTFSETLHRLMKEREVTAKRLSIETGIPRSTLSEWISGRQPKLSSELIKLARFFDVSMEYLVTGEEAEKKIIESILESSDEFVTVYKGTYRITLERKKK